MQKHISHTFPSGNSGGKVQTRSKEGRKNRQAQRTASSPSHTSRGGKNSTRSPIPSNNLPAPIQPSSPTQRSVHSSYSDASTITTAAPAGLCGSSSQNLQGHRDLTFSHTDVTQGPQPLPSHPPALGSSNGTPDYSVSYLTSSDITTFETSLTSHLGELTPFAEPSLFVQSNIDYTWHSPYPNSAQVNSFPWRDDGAMIIPSHVLSGHLHAEADGRDSTPQTLSSSQGMMPYISSEHVLSNHLANTAEHGSYGLAVSPECRSPSLTARAPSTSTSCVGDNVSGMMADDASNSDLNYDYYYTTMDSLPQFYHSSSSSLSAMITPKIQTDSSRITTSER